MIFPVEKFYGAAPYVLITALVKPFVKRRQPWPIVQVPSALIIDASERKVDRGSLKLPPLIKWRVLFIICSNIMSHLPKSLLKSTNSNSMNAKSLLYVRKRLN